MLYIAAIFIPVVDSRLNSGDLREASYVWKQEFVNAWLTLPHLFAHFLIAENEFQLVTAKMATASTTNIGFITL